VASKRLRENGKGKAEIGRWAGAAGHDGYPISWLISIHYNRKKSRKTERFSKKNKIFRMRKLRVRSNGCGVSDRK
jgi:hypothetical protein